MSFLQSFKNSGHINKINILREKFNTGSLIRVIGAHNGLSARIGEKAGFDAIWASSFEISTTFGLPDSSLISMDKYIEIVRDINNATNIPVIVDCDSGFGSLANTAKMAYDIELAGIAGISIEDNLFPKKCSLYNSKRKLISKEDHSNRIRCIKKTVANKNFIVIARTEAFIAGYGIEDALKRAEAYRQAGADAILIHSKSETPNEIYKFAEKWKNETPLACVPTTYNNISDVNLYKKGFQIIIFANHAIRASITAMKRNLKKIMVTGKTSVIDNDIESLNGVFELVEEQILQEIE